MFRTYNTQQQQRGKFILPTVHCSKNNLFSLAATITDWNKLPNNLTRMSISLNFIKGLNAHIHSQLDN